MVAPPVAVAHSIVQPVVRLVVQPVGQSVVLVLVQPVGRSVVQPGRSVALHGARHPSFQPEVTW